MVTNWGEVCSFKHLTLPLQIYILLSAQEGNVTKLILKISFLFVLLILLSIQGTTSLEQKNPIQSNQTQFKNEELSRNISLDTDFGKIPLYFVPNRGQVDETALFYAKTSSYTLWLTEEGLVFDSTRRIKKEGTESIRQNPRDINNPEDIKYDRDVSRLVFVNANRSPEVIPVDVTEHRVNYFIGKDESKWRTNIQTSRAVLYKELYPNIDLKVYGIEQQIEYDFVVKPEGEVSDIGFEYKDVEKTRIDNESNLIVDTEFGEIKHAKPVCYQVIGGERVEIKAAFKRKEDNTFGFQVKEYSKNYELIIDPLVYSTYLGGSEADSGSSITVDLEGAAYVTGYTRSVDFPAKNPLQGNYRGGAEDAFITKVNSSGNALVYSTYLGGSEADSGSSIMVDSEGAAYVTGYTASNDFPTENPLQGSKAGGRDVFITKISSSGAAIVYSTYLGGSGDDWGYDIAVDSLGAAYVTGYTASNDFPTKNPIQAFIKSSFDDIFVSKIDPSGSTLIYSTYWGRIWSDWGEAIAVDSEGAAYVLGSTILGDYPWGHPSNAFVIKIDSSGSALDYLYEWGYGPWYKVIGRGIAVDSEGAAYVTWTKFPLEEWTEENTDAFVTKINVDGDNSIYTISLGGPGDNWSTGIAIDSECAAYVTGSTDSDDFFTKNPIQEHNAGGYDIFIAKINPDGTSIVRSTYLGGSEEDSGSSIALGSDGAAYVTGYTDSDDFPTKNPIQGNKAGGRDVFITKFCFSTHSLTLAAGTNGTTDPPPGTYDYCAGSEAVIEAIPDEGFGFSHWSGDASGTDNPIKITMDSDKSITANFIRQYTLTITSEPGGTTDPTPGTYTFDAGTEVAITAIPENGYRFGGWSGDVSSTDNPITIAMNSDISIKANFIRQYTLTLTSGAGGTTDPTPATYTFDAGAKVTISAIPENGYRFGGWSGDVSSTDNPITIAMNSDISIKANFIRQYTLTLTSGPGGTTQPSPGTYVYDEGTEVTISCIPDTHCRFSHWSGDASGTSDPLTITMDSDKSITANFIRIIYAPLNFAGQKVLNRSLSQVEYINFLTWQANSNNVNILKYRIYQVEGNAQSLLVELNANTFNYWHRGVEKNKQYTYALVAVNNEGREGDRAFITLQ
jgi:hypothetical protein